MFCFCLFRVRQRREQRLIWLQVALQMQKLQVSKAILLRWIKFWEFENQNPSVLSSPDRSPAATPEAPGTPPAPPEHMELKGANKVTIKISIHERHLRHLSVRQPSLELRAFGAFPATVTPDGARLLLSEHFVSAACAFTSYCFGFAKRLLGCSYGELRSR